MLTELRIKSLKYAATQKTYFDFPNFGIRIGKRRKVFVVMIGRERRRVSLGQWPYCPAARNMDPRSASKNDPSVA